MFRLKDLDCFEKGSAFDAGAHVYRLQGDQVIARTTSAAVPTIDTSAITLENRSAAFEMSE